MNRTHKLGSRLALAGLAVLLAGMTTAHAEPFWLRTETVETLTIDGSIRATSTYIINYTITVTRTSGEYLVSTTKDPNEPFKSLKACIAISSDFWSDSGCTTSPKFSQTESLSKSSGSFAVKMKLARQKVLVSFSATGTGTTTETPTYSQSSSQTALSARVSAGQSYVRHGKPKGTVEWVGFPKAPIKGASASLTRRSGVATSADA